MHHVRATIELPAWLAQSTSAGRLRCGESESERMDMAIELARRNVAEATGGPFGAVVVEESTGDCVAAGVNLVVGSGTSVAHAESVSILLAQKYAGTHDLAARPPSRYSLYTSGQPCIMCFGVLWWSGITKLVCGARAEDIERIAGFREGPLPDDWAGLLEGRGELPPIQVVRDVRREHACDVLRAYVAAGHPVYNPGAEC